MEGRRLIGDTIGQPKGALRVVPISFIMAIRSENNLPCATLPEYTPPFTKKTKTNTEKKPKSKFKVAKIPPSQKTHHLPINPLPVRVTQLTQIFIRELADATNIITDPKDNPYLLGQEGIGETTQSRKRRVIPNQDTLSAPIRQTVKPTPHLVQELSTSTDFPHQYPLKPRLSSLRKRG